MSYFEHFMQANKAYVDLHGDYHLPLRPKTSGGHRNLYG
jgi:carbonic anhydrase